ncbi:MAG: cbb3-type cytochrome c oxidase subunit 3 [Alphaproteobacteria bacterium]
MTLVEVSDFLRSLWGVWLMVIFLGIVWWAFRPKNKAVWESRSEIPFKDDEHDKNEER